MALKLLEKVWKSVDLPQSANGLFSNPKADALPGCATPRDGQNAVHESRGSCNPLPFFRSVSEDLGVNGFARLDAQGRAPARR